MIIETTMDERENIELRSEKMRHIIGEIPPKLVRVGTGVIVGVCVLLAICLWLVRVDGERLFSLIFRV